MLSTRSIFRRPQNNKRNNHNIIEARISSYVMVVYLRNHIASELGGSLKAGLDETGFFVNDKVR